MKAYKEFSERLKLLIEKNPKLITTTLSNIFTMRLIGNKTHGDLAEIAIAEFINQYMYDYRSIHVGKDLYRAKQNEEDIKIINEISKEEFPVSLKAYGDGPLQLSTDKSFAMFPRLQTMGKLIEGKAAMAALWNDLAFQGFSSRTVLPLIYDEKRQRCNILVFDHDRAKKAVTRVVFESSAEANSGGGRGRGRLHPVYRFYDAGGNYVCEVRYGGTNANALQRGLWTHTKNAVNYFDSLSGGWISYSHNLVLVKLFSHALVASEIGHKAALLEIQKNIEQLKTKAILT